MLQIPSVGGGGWFERAKLIKGRKKKQKDLRMGIRILVLTR